MRGRIKLAPDAPEAEARARCRGGAQRRAAHTAGKSIKKFLYVPGKIVESDCRLMLVTSFTARTLGLLWLAARSGDCALSPGAAIGRSTARQAEERFAVVGVSPLVADASVVAEVEAGVRSGLAGEGRCASGSGYPRVVVEVLRIDAASEGIRPCRAARAARRSEACPCAGGPLAPLARGTRVGVLARAWVERAPGGAQSATRATCAPSM